MKYVLLILSTVLFLSCSVDKRYNLKKDINYEMNVGKQIQVPIGDIGHLRIKALLSKEAKNYFTKDENDDWIFDPKGEALTNFIFGYYKINGISFINLNDFGIPEMKFFLTLKNTLPFQYSVSAYVIDTNGNQIPNVESFLSATLPAGTAEEPGLTDATLHITRSQTADGTGFDGICIKFVAPTMPTSPVLIEHHLGISINKVSLQLPEGINLRVKKKKNNSVDES